MTRTKYWITLLLWPVTLGIVTVIMSKTSSPEEAQIFFAIAFQYSIILYLPLVFLLRARFLRLTWKEILIAMVPVYGHKLRYRIFYEK